MKQRALGRSRPLHDPVEAAPLKAVSVEFPEGRLQDPASRIFRCSGSSRFHFTRAEYRPVGMLSMGDFGFSLRQARAHDSGRSFRLSGEAMRLGRLLLESDLTVGRVVQKIGLSQRRFIQVFKQEVGMSPKLFCRVRRFQLFYNT